MKPTIFKSLLVTAIILFACVSQSFAHEQTYYHNAVNKDGFKNISIYKMNESTQTLEKYKESTVIYDKFNRPVNKTVHMWDEHNSSWTPYQTYTYDYTDTDCMINLKCKLDFVQAKKTKHTLTHSNQLATCHKVRLYTKK